LVSKGEEQYVYQQERIELNHLIIASSLEEVAHYNIQTKQFKGNDVAELLRKVWDKISSNCEKINLGRMIFYLDNSKVQVNKSAKAFAKSSGITFMNGALCSTE
jgi:2C-methyl-D-erythritol 2,4-cyclodiphosphate synthase